MQALTIADKTLQSRLFTGTGKFSSSILMRDALLASESELVTVALKRVDINNEEDDILTHLNHPHIHLLPNTSGARTAKEAVFAAQLARAVLVSPRRTLERRRRPLWAVGAQRALLTCRLLLDVLILSRRALHALVFYRP